MLRVATVRLPHLWAFLARRSAPLQRRNYLDIAQAVAAAEVWGVFDGLSDAPLAIGAVSGDGLQPGCGLAWASVQAGGLGWRAPLVVRFVRRVFRVERQRYPRAIVCFVDEANEAGQRLARLIGFLPTGNVVSGLREWRLADDGGRDHRQNSTAASAPGGSGSGRRAPAPG